MPGRHVALESEPGPCRYCEHWSRCAEHHMACEEFYAYCNSKKGNSSIPSKSWYDAVFRRDTDESELWKEIKRGR